MQTLIVFLIFSISSFGASSHRRTIPELIAHYEGWNVPNSLVARLHNPGALSFAGQMGAIRGPGGYAKWATDEEGWHALDNDLQAKVRKHHVQTLRELLRFWDSKIYLGPIAKELGISPDAKLHWLLIPDVNWGWRISFDVPRN